MATEKLVTGMLRISQERSMHHFGKAEEDKGWWAGPWNSGIPLAVGYATTAINGPLPVGRKPSGA